MIISLLAYIISFGIIGAGIGWIVVRMDSTLFIGMGVAAIAVGVASVANELKYRRH
jgi:hypothetical protein